LSLTASAPILLRVIVRFLLALLLAAFAVPAAAAPACHGDGGSMVMADHRAPARPDTAPPAHVCVGCVPVADWLRERVAAPIVPPAPGPVARIVRLAPGIGAAPALPPPRHG
jgi:hypothetical protein